MTNVLSMDPGDRFRRLMESGLCAAAAERIHISKCLIADERETPEVRQARYDTI